MLCRRSSFRLIALGIVLLSMLLMPHAAAQVFLDPPRYTTGFSQERSSSPISIVMATGMWLRPTLAA